MAQPFDPYLITTRTTQIPTVSKMQSISGNFINQITIATMLVEPKKKKTPKFMAGMNTIPGVVGYHVPAYKLCI
jgi:hypothetical protein